MSATNEKLRQMLTNTVMPGQEKNPQLRSWTEQKEG